MAVVHDLRRNFGTRCAEPRALPRRKNREILETAISAPLVRITGTEWGQLSFDNGSPPVLIYLTPGAFLERFRQNPQVLQYLGELGILSEIPGGKVSGEWAKCVGVALWQLYRQRAKDAIVGHVGDSNRPTVRGVFLTRRMLFGVFPPTRHSVERILVDPKSAHRVRGYWEAAMRELRTRGVVRSWRSREPLPTEPRLAGSGRMPSGWQEQWLDEQLDIRLADDSARAVIEIRRKAAQTLRARRRRRETNGVR